MIYIITASLSNNGFKTTVKEIDVVETDKTYRSRNSTYNKKNLNEITSKLNNTIGSDVGIFTFHTVSLFDDIEDNKIRLKNHIRKHLKKLTKCILDMGVMLDENENKVSFSLGHQLMVLNPNDGYITNVDGIRIGSNDFPYEYDVIFGMLQSVIKKSE